MANLRNLTFAVNITGNESPVVRTDRAMDRLAQTTGGTSRELATTSMNIEDLGSSRNTQAVDRSRGRIESLTRSLDSTQARLRSVSSGMKKVGSSLTKYVTLPIAGVGIASAKLSQDLNKDMATISTMIPGQTKRLHELKGEIQQISIDVAKGTSEIASGTYGVISAYGDAEDTMQKVAINAKAATAGVASTGDALALSSAVMKAFGDTSAEANEKVMDLAFGTLKLGQTSFPEMASSIGRVTPLVTELGQSQEEMFAVYAAATGVVGTAAEVSTQYAGILKGLMSPTKDMTKLMSNMGYESGKAMLEAEGLIGTLEAMNNEVGKGSVQLKDYIGSAEGQKLALALMGSLTDDYTNKLEQLYKSSGMMTEAFEEQTQGINASGFSYAQSMQRMKVAGQNLGEALGPTIAILANGFETISTKLAGVSPEVLALVAQFGMAAAAAGPLIKIGGMLISGVSAMITVTSTVTGAIAVVTGGAVAATPAITALAAVFTFITGPIGLAIGAFVGLFAILKTLEKHQDVIKEKFLSVWKGIQDGVGRAVGNIKDGLAGLTSFMENPIKGTVDIVRNYKNSESKVDNSHYTGSNKLGSPRNTKVDGSHFSGLARVPKDNYVANLHENEEVLKANDPRNQNNPNFSKESSGGIVFNATYNIELNGSATEQDKQDIKKVIDEETRKLFNIFFKEMNMKMA